jgi:hypothetical protein
MLSDIFHVYRVVRFQHDGPEQIGIDACPVLEGLFQEVAYRDNQSPQVPDSDDHVCQGYFLDTPPFVFDDNDIVDTNGLSQRDDDSGDHVADSLLSRDAHQETDNSGRGEQSRAQCLQTLKTHHDSGKGDDDHGHEGDALENAELRVHLPGLEVVCRENVEAPHHVIFQNLGQTVRDQPQRQGQEHRNHAPDGVGHRWREDREFQGGHHACQDKQHPGGLRPMP